MPCTPNLIFFSCGPPEIFHGPPGTKGPQLRTYVSEFKYLECVLDESGTDGSESIRKVASGMRVAGAIRSLGNARDLQFECTRVLHETLLVPILMYGSKAMLWKEKERSRVRAVQMDNLRGLLGVGRMDGVPNARMGELCGVRKGLDSR